MLHLHNYLRWLILLGIFYFLVLLIFLTLKKEFDKVKIKEILKKNYFFLMIAVDIQFVIGLILFGLSIKEIYALDFSTIFKTKEIRFFVVEHPLSMLIFTFFMHFIHIKIKNLEDSKKLYTIAMYLIISFIFLVIGIPWFRPLLRF